tara:strand:+ start:1198 stop:2085 length:888 start_codon:yes stop_codon:yes gene_type:complete
MKTENEKPLVVSFSGGRTSAMMARMIQISPLYEGATKHYIYANTGKEREETLDFIAECDSRWGLGTVWVEAVVNPEKGAGTRHRIVDRKSAVVNTDPMVEGHPFFDVVAKYGVFNNHYPHCTRELKTNPIRSYFASLGMRRQDYTEAWGIRADEPRRLAERPGVIYPLADLGMTERLIREFWDSQDFDLGIKQFEGNCDLCFKKSLRKRLTILKDNPQVAKDWATIEAVGDRKGGDRARFDRSGLSIDNLVEMSKSPTLEAAVDAHDIELTDPSLFSAASEINWDFETQCHCQSS